MTEGLNTARALLQAENFAGARRIVRKFLEQHPERPDAWLLRIEIEEQAGEHKEALNLCRTRLQIHPDSFALRNTEFELLLKMRKKREAKQKFERIKQDFPHHIFEHGQMKILLDAAYQRSNKTVQQIEGWSEFIVDDADKRNVGIAYHKINDLFRAQRVMQEAHRALPNDAELNACLAINSFQLARPATTRKYARLALAADPTNRHMQFLKFASYILYFPPFYVMSKMISVFYMLNLIFGKIISYIIFFSIIYFSIKIYSLSFDIPSTITGIELDNYDIVLLIFYISTYYISIEKKYFNKIFNKKKLKVRDY